MYKIKEYFDDVLKGIEDIARMYLEDPLEEDDDNILPMALDEIKELKEFCDGFKFDKYFEKLTQPTENIQELLEFLVELSAEDGNNIYEAIKDVSRGYGSIYFYSILLGKIHAEKGYDKIIESSNQESYKRIYEDLVAVGQHKNPLLVPLIEQELIILLVLGIAFRIENDLNSVSLNWKAFEEKLNTKYANFNAEEIVGLSTSEKLEHFLVQLEFVLDVYLLIKGNTVEKENFDKIISSPYLSSISATILSSMANDDLGDDYETMKEFLLVSLLFYDFGTKIAIYTLLQMNNARLQLKN